VHVERWPELRTERLLLRRWREDDRAPFAALNADPVVMEHFLATMTRAESDAFVDRIEAELDEVGYGLWAVEVVGSAQAAAFVGYVGLHRVPFAAHFSPTADGSPAVEVGWRLAREHWGRGYATEAARAAVAHGFDAARLDEIVSFTTLANERSWHVMEKLGMTRDPADDFDHPNVPAGHRLRRHVLYRLGPNQQRRR
jgi:RimJ/RimL family protein N-acetyltransferase